METMEEALIVDLEKKKFVRKVKLIYIIRIIYRFSAKSYNITTTLPALPTLPILPTIAED
jgi:hypothetical protein